MKKIKKLLFVSILAISLMGCIKVDMNMRIDKEGSLSFDMDMLVMESTLNSVGGTMDDLKSSLETEEGMNDAEFEEIEKTIDGEKWVGFNIKPKEAITEEKVATVKDGKVILEIPSELMEELADGMAESNEDMEEAEEMGMTMEMNLNFVMPGKVIENNIGEVIDDNTVKVNLLDEIEVKNIKIVSEISSSSNTMMIAVLVVGIAALAVIGFMYLKKNKAKKDTIIVEEDVVEPTVEETIVENKVEETTEVVNEEKTEE